MIKVKTWKSIRSEAVSEGHLDEERIARHKGRVLAEMRAHRLAELRNATGLNQTDMAERLHISQSRVSRIERGGLDQTQVARLRAYVEALGGELEVSARFGNERIIIG